MNPRRERGMLKERGLYPKLPEFIQLESIRREECQDAVTPKVPIKVAATRARNCF
jgi:hypothetical protein